MKLKANAKINLTLDVIGQRDDGYHLIDSIFQSIDLFDELTIEKSDEIRVNCATDTINGDSNIAYKAAKKFFEFAKICGGAEIFIEKHIPLTSGMGGGSADAAAVIVALNSLYNTKFSENELCEIGLSVGADVPFCIVGGTARVGGIGEKLQKLPDMPNCAILLVKDGQKLSTADMYRKIDSCPQNKFYTQAAVDGIKTHDFEALCKNTFNAFSAVSLNAELISLLNSTNPSAVSLSGSGPTVFSLYLNTRDAIKSKNALEEKGYSAIITFPAKSGIIVE